MKFLTIWLVISCNFDNLLLQYEFIKLISSKDKIININVNN